MQMRKIKNIYTGMKAYVLALVCHKFGCFITTNKKVIDNFSFLT